MASAVTTNYNYDKANRLLKETDGTTRTTYAYDATGNQLTQKVSTGAITTSTWDFENRNTKVAQSSGQVTTFTFNGFEQRVKKQTNMATVQFVWDGLNVLQEIDNTGLTQVVYTLQPSLFGNLVSQRRLVSMTWVTNWYHFDALGSTDRLTDSMQVVSDNYTYAAFGIVVSSSGSTGNNFTYVGQAGYYANLELARYEMYARSYQPNSGRFVSEDPLEFDGKPFELYTYVKNNPINACDPSGLYPEMIYPVYNLGGSPHPDYGASRAAWSGSKLTPAQKAVLDAQIRKLKTCAAAISISEPLKIGSLVRDLGLMKVTGLLPKSASGADVNALTTFYKDGTQQTELPSSYFQNDPKDQFFTLIHEAARAGGNMVDVREDAKSSPQERFLYAALARDDQRKFDALFRCLGLCETLKKSMRDANPHCYPDTPACKRTDPIQLF